ncbi:MAG: RND transporter [Nitrospirae bacterium GWC2_56_14]|nr:MAG: RND transporter [Nitrospirae bacterium GWC2_56_14]
MTVGSFLLTGCATVGPDYIRPEIPMPQKWSDKSSVSTPAEPRDSRALATWWATLNDPKLSELIDHAVNNNPDLKKAQAAVREARALRGVSAADQYPSLDATASASRLRSSEATGGGKAQNVYSAGLDATWELDIFGGKRRAVEAAQADLEASEADLNGVLVSLAGEVALNYVDLRSYQAKLTIAEANCDAQAETYQIAEWRHEAGLATQLDLEQAKMSLEQTRAQIPTLEAGLAAAKNRLSVLVGKHPGALDAELAETKPIPTVQFTIAVGIPADALRSRPDVQKAERQLAAQTARIGVATADLYPKLSLTGSIGLEALSPGKVFSAGNESYGLSLPISWNIFDAGRVRQNIKVQNTLQEQALAHYEATILSALEEVENALIAYAKEQTRLQSLAAAEQAAQQAFELAKTRYISGLTDFQVVLDSQRSLLTVQELRAISEAQVAADLIRLYKAVGGGWASLPGSDGQVQKRT